jgi:NAD(P)H dehydrogenase (quinone)
VILAGPRPLDGPVSLTAASAVTFDDIAVTASELTGRDIRRVVLHDEQWVAARVAEGLPEAAARMLLGFFAAARRGDFAATGPALGELLGRAPRTVRDLLADRVAA